MKKKEEKQKKQKKPMRNGLYLAIHIPLLAIALILVLGLNLVASMGESMFNSFAIARSEKLIAGETSANVNAEYYTAMAANSEEARKNSEAVAQKVSDEGEVLLKNNGVLPLEQGAEVTPFGYAYLNPAYSGTGAGASNEKNNITPETALQDFFMVNNAAVEKMEAAEVQSLLEAAGTNEANKQTSLLTNDSTIYQYPAETYAGIEEQIGNSTALVFLTRQGNEGADKKMDAYSDGTPHYLALSEEEKATIKFAKESCKNLVCILVSSNAMELTPLLSGEYEADAILWIGNPGSQGFASMSKILTGQVNPSGKLVDTYASDFTADPTYANMGVFAYANGGETPEHPGYYIEYQEGIYSGYRYYETADLMDDAFVYGSLNEEGAWLEAGAVCYPFGYGLSYTSFEQKLVSSNYDGDRIQVEVEVTNVGAVAGKEVVELYYTAPYTSYDMENAIEKSVVELEAFEKTKELQPGESQTIKMDFAAEDMASYSYLHDNGDGSKGCYLLEAGDYEISLRKNSHEVIDSFTITLAETTVFDGGHSRASDVETATNQFEECNSYMTSETVTLTRANWTETQPKMVEGRSKTVSDAVYTTYLNSFEIDVENDEVLGNQENSKVYAAVAPVEKAENGLVLSALRGLEYDDPSWDALLDQLDYSDEQVISAIFGAGYQTSEIDSIGKVATKEQDGDTGLNIGADTSSWPSKPVLAATWNKDLMYEVGAAFGQEALTDGLSGWYAPAMNIHRSPFAGRNLEYFSEDGYLSGILAASIVSGAGDNGLVCYIKHFAVNDQETNRENYLNTWADEQTIREIYMQPFELCIKNATMTVNYTDSDGNMASTVMPATTGVMSAQSCIGTQICLGNYGLLTGVLRNEWGFHGTVITDLYMNGGQTIGDQMLRAGGDIYLIHNVAFLRQTAMDTTSATAKTAMREAIHHLCYSYVNSAAYNGIAPGTYIQYGSSKLKYIMMALNILIALLFIRKIHIIVVRVKNNKRTVK